jgi:hypothetical protein
MKNVVIRFQFVVLLLIVVGNSFAQIKSEGTRTEKDSATGITRTTTFVEVKEEEVITPRHNIIAINPLKFFLFWNLSFYHSFDNLIAVGVGAQMPTISYFKGFGFNAEVRLYPSKKALRGFYVAPNASWNHLKYEYAYFYSDGSSSLTADTYSIGVLLGWQWFIGDDFAMGLGLGFDHYFLSGKSSGYDYSPFSSYEGNAPALRFDIGYGW